MKRILAMLLAMIMVLSMFAGCRPNTPIATTEPTTVESTQDAQPDLQLEKAIEYLRAFYKNAAEKTPMDYARLATVRIGITTYDIVWSVDVSEEVLKIVKNDDNTYTIDINEEAFKESTEPTPYVLTATITGKDGRTLTISWEHIIPAAIDQDSIDAIKKAYALAPGETLDGTYTVIGVIKAIKTPYDPSYKNITVTIEVAGAEDMPIVCYRLKGDGADKLAVGDTITVTGSFTNYNGQVQFAAGCILEAVESGGGAAPVAPENPLDILKQAYALAPGESLPYNCSLSGVITFVDQAYSPDYGNITVTMKTNGYTIKCYRIKGDGVDQLNVNDEITVSGVITNYNGTIEFAAGSILVSRVDHEPPEKLPDPTPGTTLTVAQAYNVGLGKDHDTYTEGSYYITGKIVSIENDIYGNMHISDGTGKLMIYGTWSEDGNTRYDKLNPKPAVGDTVTLYGKIGRYGSNPQMKNAWIIGAKGDTPVIPDAPSVDVATELVAGTPYRFGMAQGNLEDAVYYLAGGMNGYYMATTADPAAAINVYVEETAGGYYFYTLDGETKLYINMVVSADGAHVNGSYNATASTVYTYNSASNTLIATIDGAEYWFGTRNDKTYTTMGPCKVEYAGFFGKFYVGSAEAPVPPTPEDPDVPQVGELVADKAYKFGMAQGNLENKVFYLKGGMDGYYMATTDDMSAAIDVYVEQTEGGYYFYIKNGEEKQYINMVVSGTHVNGAYEATASTVYTYDAEKNTLIAIVNDAEYWFGTRNDKTYTTMGPCKVEYAGFFGQFYDPNAETDCQHTETKVEGAVEATCTTDGHTGKTLCAACGEIISEGEVIPATGHSFENGTCTKCGEAESEEPSTPAGGKADFNTIVTTNANGGDSSYTKTFTTTDGWVIVNSAIQVGGSTVMNPQFPVIGPDNTHKAVCLNGKVSAPGSITSPTLTGGISKLTMSYTKMFTDTKLSATITITDLATGTVYTNTAAIEWDKNTKYEVETFEWVLETPITGDFTIVVVNDCPTGQTGNKDRMTILELAWEASAAPEQPTCQHTETKVEGAVEATCTTDGHTGKTLCAACGEVISEGEVIPATGHSFANGTCGVCGEADPDYVPETPAEPTFVTSIAPGTAYKLGLHSTNKNATYYFTGAMSGYYGATETAYEKGIDVFVEETTGGYYLYFLNASGAKQYINLVASGNYKNFTFAATASSVYTWDADKNALYTTIGTEVCYIGTYGTYVTMGVLQTSKLKDTDYIARLYTLGGSSEPEQPTCQHTETKVEGAVAATCTTDGHTGKTVCAACDEVINEGKVIVAFGHSFANGTCGVCGEADPDYVPETPAEPTFVTSIAPDTAYKLGLHSTNKNATYYFTGAMSGYYGTTETAYEKGIDVFVEETTGGYHLYFLNASGAKQYINLVASGNYKNFTFAATASSVYTWDADKNALYTTIGTEVCYIGTYGTYVTMGVLQTSKLKDTDYIARLYTLGGSSEPEQPTCQHTETKVEGAVEATCTTDGHTGKTLCAACDEVISEGEVIPATGHSFANGTCGVCGEADPDYVPETPAEPTFVTSIAPDTAYKLGLHSTNKNATYYFTGAMSGYYGATETAYEKGIDVFVEETTDGYYLYFLNASGAKQYINLVASGTYKNFTFAATASSVYTWDADKNALYTTIGTEVCYIGTYGTYVTMGVLQTSKLKDTDYIARLYTLGGSSEPEEPTYEHVIENGGGYAAALSADGTRLDCYQFSDEKVIFYANYFTEKPAEGYYEIREYNGNFYYTSAPSWGTIPFESITISGQTAELKLYDFEETGSAVIVLELIAENQYKVTTGTDSVPAGLVFTFGSDSCSVMGHLGSVKCEEDITCFRCDKVICAGPGHEFGEGTICFRCFAVERPEEPSEPSSATYTMADYVVSGELGGGSPSRNLDENVNFTISSGWITSDTARIYKGSNGVITSQKPIASLVLNAGYKTSTFVVYTSEDGTTWTEHSTQSYVSGYGDVTISFETPVKYIKLDAVNQQIRIKTITVNFA